MMPNSIRDLARVFSCWTAVAILVSTLSATAQEYRLEEIVNPFGGFLFAADINRHGQIVGGFVDPSGYFHAFIFQKRLPIEDLGTLPGGDQSWATSINDRGEVTGYADAPPFHQRRPFLWLPEPRYGLPAGMNDIGPLSDQYESFGQSVNNHGEIVGEGGAHGFIWLPTPAYGLPAGMNDLGLPSGTDYSAAYGINDNGLVILRAQTTQFIDHAFVWQNGTYLDIGNLGGPYGYSLASAISRSGMVAGYSEVDTTLNMHSYLWQPLLGMKDLGTVPGFESSFALDVNISHDVVGVSRSSHSPTTSVAFLCRRDGQMIDLNRHVTPPPIGLALEQARAINDRGEIVAVGQVAPDDWRSFLLTPVAAIGAQRRIR